MDASINDKCLIPNRLQGLEVFHTVVEDNASIRSFSENSRHICFFLLMENLGATRNGKNPRRNPSAYVQTKCREVRGSFRNANAVEIQVTSTHMNM